MPMVRAATEDDLPAVLAIYNEVIANSTAVYTLEPSTLDERRAWFSSRTAMGFPVLVAVDASGDVLGFSSFGEWRGAWPGYRYTVEHSVHVRHDRRGTGIGRALVEALFPCGLALGKHVMIGGIDAANDASIRFHERLGFERVGQFREVGHKFGGWLDLVFVQRFLDPPGTPRRPPRHLESNCDFPETGYPSLDPSAPAGSPKRLRLIEGYTGRGNQKGGGPGRER